MISRAYPRSDLISSIFNKKLWSHISTLLTGIYKMSLFLLFISIIINTLDDNPTSTHL